MTTPGFEVCIQESVDDFFGFFRTGYPCTQGQDIGVVMLPTHLGQRHGGTEGSPDALDFVGDNSHADPAATDEDTPVDLALGYGPGDAYGYVRIIDGFGRVGSKIGILDMKTRQ